MATLTRLQTRAVIRHKNDLPPRFYRYSKINHTWNSECTRNAVGWTITAFITLGACVVVLRVFVA